MQVFHVDHLRSSTFKIKTDSYSKSGLTIQGVSIPYSSLKHLHFNIDFKLMLFFCVDCSNLSKYQISTKFYSIRFSSIRSLVNLIQQSLPHSPSLYVKPTLYVVPYDDFTEESGSFPWLCQGRKGM